MKKMIMILTIMLAVTFGTANAQIPYEVQYFKGLWSNQGQRNWTLSVAIDEILPITSELSESCTLAGFIRVINEKRPIDEVTAAFNWIMDTPVNQMIYLIKARVTIKSQRIGDSEQSVLGRILFNEKLNKATLEIKYQLQGSFAGSENYPVHLSMDLKNIKLAEAVTFARGTTSKIKMTRASD